MNLPSSPSPLHEQARRLAIEGRPAAAEEIYLQLLRQRPDDSEALNFLAACAMGRDRPVVAIDLLRHALEKHPADGPTRKNLGVALIQSGQLDEAEQLLRETVDATPEFFVARLYLGLAQERQHKQSLALASYFKAINHAQRQGYWLSDQSTPAGLRAPVTHAIRYLREGRRQVLGSIITGLRDSHGRESMQRVEKALAGYLGEREVSPPDPLQRPTFFYFPDLPTTPYFEASRFPWYEELEGRTADLRNELLSVLEEKQLLLPFLGTPQPGQGRSYLDGDGSGHAPQWDGFFFHRHGRRFDDNCERCPKTAEALDRTSLVRIPGHAPEALYSILGPGSHIRPHTGVTNTRVVTHLPLLVPEKCALSVAGVEHAWREGHCISFDDTFEHEAWNHGTQTRVILLFDVWNPHLTDAEQAAITQLVAGIGELNGELVLAE